MPTTVTRKIRSSGGDYTTLSAWEAGEQTNLVTADQIAVAECYDDWATGLSDDVNLSGWTVDSTRYIKITVASGHRHNGTPQSGFFMKKAKGFGAIVSVGQSYTRLEWLDVENTNAGGDTHGIYTSVVTVYIDKCIAKTTTNNAANAAFAPSSSSVITNCLAWGGYNGFLVSNFGTPNVYNCVAANCTRGFSSAGTDSAPLYKNCVAYSNTTNWYNNTYVSASCDCNATSSGTDDAPGGNSVISVASGAFSNAAGNDYHLSSGSALRGAGTNLYSTFTTDIDGNTWPSAGAWDIGYDYYASAAATSLAFTPRFPRAILNF